MRVVSFITLLFLVTLLPWYILLALVCCYALYFELPIELVVLAALIDGFFGVASTMPLYTITTTIVLFLSEWVKPRLMIYNAS